MTYVNEDKLIFSGDAFGCFGTLDGGITDSQLNTDKYWSEWCVTTPISWGNTGQPYKRH